MYLVELHGKLPSRFSRMEDLLTSNIFSFFKYSDRKIFLKGYLESIGFKISIKESAEAEFRFWPQLDDQTEPDLVIIAGSYYLLFEAKYFSDFGAETKVNRAQLIREIEGGISEAKKGSKKFCLIAITADHYYKKEKFTIIPERLRAVFKWTNWQQVAEFILNILEYNSEISTTDREFASDLYSLLVKKNLRDYIGPRLLRAHKFNYRSQEILFFDSKTAIFRGDFIGFVDSLQFKIRIKPELLMDYKIQKENLFSDLMNFPEIKKLKGQIFYEA